MCREGVVRCWQTVGARGIATAEFALVAPLLLLLLGAATDLGSAIERSIRLQSASHAGAMYGSLMPDDKTNAAQSLAASMVSNVPSAAVSVTMTCQCPLTTAATTGPVVNCSIICPAGLARYITVDVSAPFTGVFPLSNYMPFETIGALAGHVVARVS